MSSFFPHEYSVCSSLNEIQQKIESNHFQFRFSREICKGQHILFPGRSDLCFIFPWK